MTRKISGAYFNFAGQKIAMEEAGLDDETYQKMVKSFFNSKKEKEELPKQLAAVSTVNEANDLLHRYCDSYDLLPALIISHELMDRNLWLATVGLNWSSFDNVWEYREKLLNLFQGLTRKQFDLLMDEDEINCLNKMPESIDIFRGCYEINKNGISWTTKREIAEEFTTLNRYRIDGGIPLLLEATFPRSHAVLKLHRQEFEIIVTDLALLRPVSPSPEFK
jgi:hypothetical protein